MLPSSREARPPNVTIGARDGEATFSAAHLRLTPWDWLLTPTRNAERTSAMLSTSVLGATLDRCDTGIAVTCLIVSSLVLGRNSGIRRGRLFERVTALLLNLAPLRRALVPGAGR
jgi:hypothetical protein